MANNSSISATMVLVCLVPNTMMFKARLHNGQQVHWECEHATLANSHAQLSSSLHTIS